MEFTRRAVTAGLATLVLTRPSWSLDTAGDTGIGYLEGLGQPGALNPKIAFIPPSRIDPAYSHAIYVNTALRGPGWQLALWDREYWDDQGAAPSYSWPVSTGRHYKGDRRSGPTPVGIFNPDDRKTRHRRGWGSRGMYNSIYIDLHYTSGRASGVAMHGTTRSRYRLLGRADSHGCIRMRQPNADQVWNMFHPSGRPGPDSPLWSEAVPRYFSSAPVKGTRRGYVRDGAIFADAETGERLTKPGYAALFVFFRDDL